MSFTAASLSDGQVSNTTAAIYTSSGVKTVVKSLDFFNTSSSTPQTVNLYITRNGGTRRQVRRFLLEPYGAAIVLHDGQTFILSAGDTIDSDATSATTVNFIVMGATE